MDCSFVGGRIAKSSKVVLTPSGGSSAEKVTQMASPRAQSGEMLQPAASATTVYRASPRCVWLTT